MYTCHLYISGEILSYLEVLSCLNLSTVCCGVHLSLNVCESEVTRGVVMIVHMTYLVIYFVFQ